MARRHYRVVGGEVSLFRVDEDGVEPVLVVTVEPTRGERARDPTAHDDDGAPCLADALAVRVRVRVRVGVRVSVRVRVRVRVRV